MTAFSEPTTEENQGRQQVSSYGSINVDEERAGLLGNGGDNEMDGSNDVSSLSRARRTNNNPKRSTLVIGVLVMLAIMAAILNLPTSPLYFYYLINSNSAPGTPKGHSFYASSWKQWAYGVRDYWADKREAWATQKADLKGKNATKAEIKEAKHAFWNSTVNEFGAGSLNSQPAWPYDSGDSNNNDDDE